MGSQPGADRISAKAESVPEGFGTDPLNLLQVMLAKGSLPRIPPPAAVGEEQ